MKMQIRCFLILVCFVILVGVPTFAQTTDSRKSNSSSEAQEELRKLPLNATSVDIVANEIGLLRKSLQTLNVRLREISSKLFAPDAGVSPADRQARISLNLELLTRAEQRAESLRKQLIELVEKETSLKSRLVQIEEDMRPESIERSMNLVGSTRTSELRDVRRRVLETEKKGFETLLSLTSQSRVRLEEDVRQADLLVSRLRQRVLPLIENEIEKITPN